MDDQGVQIGASVPFSISGSASGLAYDLISGNLWTRDTVNQMAVEINSQTGQVVSLVAIPGDEVRYGTGR